MPNYIMLFVFAWGKHELAGTSRTGDDALLNPLLSKLALFGHQRSSRTAASAGSVSGFRPHSVKTCGMTRGDGSGRWLRSHLLCLLGSSLKQTNSNCLASFFSN